MRLFRPDWRRVIQRFIRRGMGRDTRPILRAAAPVVVARLPSSFSDAVRALSDQRTVDSLPFRKRAVWDTKGSGPEIIRFANALCKELRSRGFPMYVVQGWRSAERQQAAFDAGVSKALPGRSPHNHGMAVDIVHFSRSWDLTPKEWAVIGAIGKDVARRLKMKMTWGGDWKFYDPAHWELTDWRERK